jgi:hypothetical protein
LEQAGGGVLLLMTQVVRVIINQKSRGSDNERIVSPKKKLSPKNCFHMWNSPAPSNKEAVCVCVCVCVKHVKKDGELDGWMDGCVPDMQVCQQNKPNVSHVML